MDSVSRFCARFPCFYLFACFHVASAQSGYLYQLDSEYSGANFFQGWDFYTGGDPTGGYVTYYSQSAAQLTGLINSSATAPAYIGVDHQTVTNLNGAGRPSVRIATQKSWTHGLFIGDFGHAPGGICGTWPAFWTLGPNWPYTGEIDILEGANQLTQNAMSLHSNVNCSIAGDPTTETGTVQGKDCAYYVQYGGNGQGCGVLDSRTTSYGTGFNSVGGGVYAMQWTSNYIRVWFFQRNQIPEDITNLIPNPSSWGLPAANLQGSCNIDTTFQSHKIIFDNTFCGSYAGVAEIWNASTNSCLLQTGYPTCNQFVAAQPAAFQNAYWSINSVRVYQLQAAGVSSTTSSVPYIASLQPTSSSASVASLALAAVPTASLCPNYNFSVVQNGPFQYEIECGYNPPGSDLGKPYASYQVASFEDCVAGCTYWNSYNGSYSCGGVAFQAPSSCYWKKSITSAPANSKFNGARLIYYGYPQSTDSPNFSTASSTSAFVSTIVTPQIYSNPTATQSSRALSTASGSKSIFGVGMGNSVVATPNSGSSSSSTAPLSLTTVASDSNQSSPPNSTSMFSLASTPASATSPSTTSNSSAQPSSVSVSTATDIVVIKASSSIASTMKVSPLSSKTFSVAQTSISFSTSSPSSSQAATLTSRKITSALSLTTATQWLASSSSISLSSAYSLASTPPVAITTSSPLLSLASLSGVVSSSTSTLLAIPQNIAIFTYGGCQGSSDNFAGFRLVESESTLTVPQCVSYCYNDAYAGFAASAHNCYCAADPSVAKYFVTYPNPDCGSSPNQQWKRQAGLILTIYNNTEIVPGPDGFLPSSSATVWSSTDGSGSSVLGTVGVSSTSQGAVVISLPLSVSLSPTTSSSSATLISAVSSLISTTAPLSSATGNLAPGGGNLSSIALSAPISTILLNASIITSAGLRPTAITTIFVDVCDVCEHGMTTATTVITMMHCGCIESVNHLGITVSVPAPSIPMATTVKDCSCGDDKASSTTEVTVPCTSQIEEMSSSMASMLSAAVAVAAPAGATSLRVSTGSEGSDTSDEDVSRSSETSNGLVATSESRSTEVAQLTGIGGPEAGTAAVGISIIEYATTQTIYLQSAEISNVARPNNGSMHAPLLTSDNSRLAASPTKKSEGTSTVGKLLSIMVTSLLCVVASMSLL